MKTTLNKLILIQIAIDILSENQFIKKPSRNIKYFYSTNRPPPLVTALQSAFYFPAFCFSYIYNILCNPFKRGGCMRAHPLAFYLCNANY